MSKYTLVPTYHDVSSGNVILVCDECGNSAFANQIEHHESHHLEMVPEAILSMRKRLVESGEWIPIGPAMGFRVTSLF